MVMSKGQVDADLLAWCIASGIIILQHVPYKALLALADEKGVVTYITDATEVSNFGRYACDAFNIHMVCM